MKVREGKKAQWERSATQRRRNYVRRHREAEDVVCDVNGQSDDESEADKSTVLFHMNEKGEKMKPFGGGWLPVESNLIDLLKAWKCGLKVCVCVCVCV